MPDDASDLVDQQGPAPTNTSPGEDPEQQGGDPEGPQPGEQGGKNDEAGDPTPDTGPGPEPVPSGASFPYRWAEEDSGWERLPSRGGDDSPTFFAGQIDGPLPFSGSCYDDRFDSRRPVECRFSYTTDEPLQEKDSLFTLLDPSRIETLGVHRACVNTKPPLDDITTYDRPYRRACIVWEQVSPEPEFRWLTDIPDSASTSVQVSLRCHALGAFDADAEADTSCEHRCSLDGKPSQPCAETLQLDNLAPGPHQLRVLTWAPGRDDALADVQQVQWTTAQDALPLHVPEQWGATERREAWADVEDYLTLVDTYLDLAARCVPQVDVAEHRTLIERFLDLSVASPAVNPQREQYLSTCLSEMDYSVWPCPGNKRGQPASWTGDGLLAMRLPGGCRELFQGTRANGELCATSAECRGSSCERARDAGADVSLGRCATYNDLAREHDPCLERGCAPGLYCDAGRCTTMGEDGDTCDPALGSLDCRPGLVCEGAESSTCTPAPQRTWCFDDDECADECEKATRLCR